MLIVPMAEPSRRDARLAVRAMLRSMRYSFFSLARNALVHHRYWQQAWRSPEPRKHYSIVIIGGGGHGLATAYYLARLHGIRLPRYRVILDAPAPQRKPLPDVSLDEGEIGKQDI